MQYCLLIILPRDHFHPCSFESTSFFRSCAAFVYWEPAAISFSSAATATQNVLMQPPVFLGVQWRHPWQLLHSCAVEPTSTSTGDGSWCGDRMKICIVSDKVCACSSPAHGTLTKAALGADTCHPACVTRRAPCAWPGLQMQACKCRCARPGVQIQVTPDLAI